MDGSAVLVPRTGYVNGGVLMWDVMSVSVCPKCFSWLINGKCECKHDCSFEKQVVLFSSVIGICECGKEKKLNAEEIDTKKQINKGV